MATITIKKTRNVNTNGISLAAVVSLPAYRTRDDARAVANRLRERGVTPTTPTKTDQGWKVSAKHSGGVLSRRK